MILAPDGSLKVTDFGVAKAFNLSPLSLPADAWGTAGFVAPEYFTGKPFTRRSDLYALGGLLYCLVTGRPPYPAGTLAELMHKHCYVLPDRPAQFVPKIPPELDDLICDLLAKDPGRRSGSAAAVLADLDAVRGRVERKGETVPWPADPGDTAMHAALAETSPGPDTSVPREKPLLSRAVVVPAFRPRGCGHPVLRLQPRPEPRGVVRRGVRPDAIRKPGRLGQGVGGLPRPARR